MTPSRIEPDQLHPLFDHTAGESFQRAVVQGVREGYTSTWLHCQNFFEDETQVQAWRFSRWVGIDSALLAVGRRFKAFGVEAEFKCNTAETDVKHTELRFGRFVMTAACVQSRTELPRPAEYRQFLLQGNATLFNMSTQEDAQELIWTPLLHIPDPAARQPRAIYVAFPDGDGGFAVEHIDLGARYPLVVVGNEDIKDEAIPKMRPETEHGS